MTARTSENGRIGPLAWSGALTLALGLVAIGSGLWKIMVGVEVGQLDFAIGWISSNGGFGWILAGASVLPLAAFLLGVSMSGTGASRGRFRIAVAGLVLAACSCLVILAAVLHFERRQARWEELQAAEADGSDGSFREFPHGQPEDSIYFFCGGFGGGFLYTTTGALCGALVLGGVGLGALLMRRPRR